MSFALVYLAYRFFYRLEDFLHHWYFDSSRRIAHWFLSLMERIDRVLAIRITIKYFFEPLYKDYSIVGRLLGVIFRSGRILVGFVVYAFLTLVFLAIYLAWIFIPPFVVFYAVSIF